MFDEGGSRPGRLCSGSGFSCWWEIVKHLGWTLLGIADIEPFTASDSLSNNIAQALYAGFIISALILLVNMMIAVLSSTYERVESNSLREWSLRKAIIIRTFSNYHPIPVPLNLISHLGMLFLRCCKACRRRYGSRKCYSSIPDYRNTAEEDLANAEKDRNLKSVLDKLKAVYFSTHGSSFPLTDESKISNMLIETRRNREMCNQIARKVFFNQSHTTKVAPVGPDAWISPGIQIEGCLFTYVGQELCKTCKLEAQNFHGARYKLPFSESFPKLEVLIQEDGKKRELVVGVVRANHKLHKSAGESNDTIGYYTSNGHLLNACKKKETQSSLQPVEDKMAYRGDLIVCLVDFDKIDEERRVPINFTLNGALIYEDSMTYERGKRELYPFIGMSHKGIRVLAKVCSGTTDIEDSTLAVAKLKESNDIQFQKLQKRISDICENIAFSNQTSAEGVATTGPNNWFSAGIRIDGYLFTYIARDLISPRKMGETTVHIARYKQPFSASFPRLEVVIKEDGKKRELVVGLVRFLDSMDEPENLSEHTIDYCASNGRIQNSFEREETEVIQVVEGKMAFPGDLIACIVDYGNFKNGRVPVVFTLNGEMIYEASVTYGKENCELYPIIRMSHGAEGMRVLAKVYAGKKEEGTCRDFLSRTADSIAKLKEANDIEFQNLHQRIANVADEKQKKIDEIVREQERKIDSMSDSLSEVLQILRDINVKTRAV